jgi:hypothetical protein
MPIDGVSLSVSNQGLISSGGSKVRRSPIINPDIKVVAHVDIHQPCSAVLKTDHVLELKGAS